MNINQIHSFIIHFIMCGSNIILIATMVIAAFLTGSANYYSAYDKDLEKNIRTVKYWTSVLLSLCAVVTVPLFLQIVSNDLLDKLDFKNMLIFSGFCVLAGLYSKRFLENLFGKIDELTNKVKNQEKETKETKAALEKTETKAENASKKAESANSKTEALEANFEEPEKVTPVAFIRKNTLTADDQRKLDQEQLVIEAFTKSKYIHRTLQGIIKDCGLDEPTVQSLLEEMTMKGILHKQQKSNGTELWRL